MAQYTGDLMPRVSGSASLGVEMVDGKGGFTTDIRPFANVHQNSGVLHDARHGTSGVIRYAAPYFEVSPNGGVGWLAGQRADANFNLITFPEDFSQWDVHLGSPTITTNTALAPDGTLTADNIEDDNVSAYEQIKVEYTVPADTNYYCVALFVQKDATATAIAGMNINLTGTNPTISMNPRFRVDTGEVMESTVGEGPLAIMIDHNADWWRVISTPIRNDGVQDTLLVTINAASRRIVPLDTGDNVAATGDLTAWGAKLMIGKYMAEYETPYISTINDVPPGTGLSGFPNGDIILEGVNGIDVSSPADFTVLVDGVSISGITTLQQAYENNPLLYVETNPGPLGIITGPTAGRKFHLETDSVAHLSFSGVVESPTVELETGDLTMHQHGMVVSDAEGASTFAEAQARSLGIGSLQLNTGSGVANVMMGSGIQKYLATGSQAMAAFPTYTIINFSSERMQHDQYYAWDSSVTGVRFFVAGTYLLMGIINYVCTAGIGGVLGAMDLNGATALNGMIGATWINAGLYSSIPIFGTVNIQAGDYLRVSASKTGGTHLTITNQQSLHIVYLGPPRGGN